MQDIFVSFPDLLGRVSDIFTVAGFTQDQANAAARTIAQAERDGCKPVGLYRIDGAMRTARAGKLNPLAVPKVQEEEGSAIVRVTAEGGLANLALEVGVPHLARKTREHGIAALVVNDCVHFAALWPEVEMVTQEGLACIAMCPSYATVAPAGGIRPLLGTNPFAFGWPRPGTTPYILDFATSVVARGEIEMHRVAGKALPEGWALDANGTPTTDPAAALQGAMLTFGGYKGSGLSTMIEILSAAMIGDLDSRAALEVLGSTTLNPRHGELILALDPARFGAERPGNPLDRAETILNAITDQGARLPSQRRFECRAIAETLGIQLTAAELRHLERLSTPEGQAAFLAEAPL